MRKDLITIVIPTYNGEDFICDCLSSIASQEIPHEIIVVDDLSTDHTIEIARKMGAKVIVNDIHKGQVAGKNTGILNMSGNYFLTIDQDDRLKPDALKNLLRELKDNDGEIVMARLEDFGQTLDDKRYCHTEPFRGILTGTTLFKKEVFDTIGLFDETISTGDVIDLTYRCERKGVKIIKTDIITCERRIHSNNYGRNKQKEEYKDYAKLLRKQFIERTKLKK